MSTDKPPPSGGFSLSQLGVGGVLVAMLLSAFGLRTSSPTGEKPAATTPVIAVPSVLLANAIDPPRELLLRFFQPIVSVKLKQETPPLLTRLFQPAVTEKPTPEPFLKEEAERIEDVLIVAVPDPIQTAFGHWYDHLIETYTEAMVDAGYTPDRHWLPWENLRRDEKDVKDREKATSIDSFPGIMLFRKTMAGQLKYGIVFFVGETTNVGVNSHALRRTLELVRELHLAKMDDKPQTVKIVGPLFTGSQLSWLRSLRDWMPKTDSTTRVELITGSANALTPIEKGWPNEILGDLSKPTRVTQRTTIVSNELLTNAALHFLKAGFCETPKVYQDIQKPPDGLKDVAFLKESSTGFGTSSSGAGNEYTDLRYPLYISRLSAAVREENRKRMEKIGITPGVRVGGTDVVHDEILSLGGTVTPALADRMIGDAMAVIRRKEIRHVGIVATDSRDVVFLTNRVRNDCPNARIFLTEADLLFATPENSHEMRGVVIATTYPLYPPNQEWTGSNANRRFFASQFIQGCYNAVCAQLGKDENLREYRPPYVARGDGEAEPAKTPPVWITTVGENGRFLPLHIFSNCPDPQLYVPTHAKTPPKRVSVPLMNTARIAALLAILVCTFVLVRFRKSYWVFENESEHALADMPKLHERIGPYRHMFLFAILAAMTPLLMLPNFALSSEYHRNDSRWLTVCFTTMLLCFIAIWAYAFWGQIRLLCDQLLLVIYPIKKRSWKSEMRFVLHLILFVFGPLLFLGLMLFQEGTGVRMLLFMDRATALHTGYSVIVPATMMAIAFLIYARFAVYRDRMCTLFNLKPPFAPISDVQLPFAPDVFVARAIYNIHKKQQRLSEDLGDFLDFCKNNAAMIDIALGIFAPPVLFVLGRLRRSWEGVWWDTLFWVGFVVLIAMVILNLLRFLAGWKTLEAILSQIAALPYAPAFGKLPPAIAGTFAGFLYNIREQPYRVSISATLWRRIRLSGVLPNKNYPDPEPIIDAIKPTEGAGAVVNALSIRAADVAEWLRTYWPESRVENSSTTEKPKTVEIANFPVSSCGITIPKAIDPKAWIADTEQFLAVQTVMFLGVYFVHLRKLALSAIYTMLMLLLAATTYPFQPENLIMTLMAGLAVTVAVVIGHVLVQVNRNELVSRIAGNEPNKFTPDWTFLWSNLALLAPFAVAAAQVSGRLRSVFEPILGLIR